MKNVYQLQVRAVCPIHKELIDVYEITVTSNETIKVETILDCFEKYRNQQVLQEEMTRQAAVSLGASVLSVGIHAGVSVICLAP